MTLASPPKPKLELGQPIRHGGVTYTLLRVLGTWHGAYGRGGIIANLWRNGVVIRHVRVEVTE